MKLSDALLAKEFDIRIKDRRISQQAVTQEEWNKYLKDLPDSVENLITIGEIEDKMRAECSDNPSREED